MNTKRENIGCRLTKGRTFSLQQWCAIFVLLNGAACGWASDWPQYRGANHDGQSIDRIQKQWPDTGPREVWRVPCTNGLSSFAVSGDRAYTQIRRRLAGNDREVCISLDAWTGQELWAADIDQAVYPGGGVGTDDGPRSTPTVEGGRVYVLSSYQKLQCLDATNGTAIWRKDLVSLYGARVIDWQSAASPLLEQGLILVNCGSTSQSLLALKASDGSLAWRTQTESMTQSTPVIATIAGVRQVIHATQSGLVSLNCTNGALLWKANYPFSYTTSLAMSPLVHSNIVFISANYTMGAFATRISASGSTWTATPAWTNISLKSQWMNAVATGGFIYGLFGSTPSLKCMDVANGSQKWSMSGFGRGGVTLVDNSLMVLSEQGDLVLVSTNTTSYTELARWSVFPGYDPDANKCWNVPAVCDGRVYARSTASAVCLDIAVPPLKILAPILDNGQLRLRVTTQDGTPLTDSRASGVQLRYSSDVSLPSSQWTLLPGQGTLMPDGVIEMTDPAAGDGPRFYLLTESL